MGLMFKVFLCLYGGMFSLSGLIGDIGITNKVMMVLCGLSLLTVSILNIFYDIKPIWLILLVFMALQVISYLNGKRLHGKVNHKHQVSKILIAIAGIFIYIA